MAVSDYEDGEINERKAGSGSDSDPPAEVGEKRKLSEKKSKKVGLEDLGI